jgi:hypothetical protein
MQYFGVKTKTKTAVTHYSKELEAYKWHQNTLKTEKKRNLK